MATKRRRRPDRASQYEDPTYRKLLEQLALNLRALREEHGWTQEEAAHRCDMSTRFFQALEGQEKNFTATTLARLAAGFKIDVSALLGDGTRLRAVAGVRKRKR